MAVERAQGLGQLRFAIDAEFIDETVYTFQSPDGRSSICVEFEPIRDAATDTSAERLERTAQELNRVYDDAQINAPVPVATGAGLGLMMRARVLGDIEIGAAALDRGTVRVYVTATTEGGPTPAFPVVVESIRVVGEALPAAPPGYGWTGAGTVLLCIPDGWTLPSVARCRWRSAIVQIGLGKRETGISPGDVMSIAPGETVALDGRERAPDVRREGMTFGTTVATYTVRDEAAVPRDVIMIRATDVAREADQRGVGFLVGLARSADWPRLIQAWGPLVQSIRVEP